MSGAAMATALVACQTVQDVQLTDRSVFYSLRLTHGLWGPTKFGEQGDIHRVALELDLDGVSGSGSQRLDPSDVVDFGGTDFVGPVQLEEDYRLRSASLAVRPSVSDPADRFQLAGLLGLAVLDCNVRVSAGTVSADDDRRSVGPLFGGEGALGLSSWSDLYGRGSLAIGLTDATTTLSVFELGLSVRPHRRVALAAGFRWQRYTQPRLLSQMFGFDETRIDLKVHGPVARLQLDF